MADYSSSSDSDSERGGRYHAQQQVYQQDYQQYEEYQPMEQEYVQYDQYQPAQEYITYDAQPVVYDDGLYEIEEEGERVAEIVRGDPYLQEERVISRRNLPEELVSTELLEENRVSETEISRTVVAKQRVIQNRVSNTIEVPVETIIETLSVQSNINVLEFPVEELDIHDREKVVQCTVRLPYANDIRRPKHVEVEVPFVENYVDRPKIVPVERIVTKIVPKYVEKILEVPVERIVVQEEQVFVEKIRERIIEVPVEKIIEKIVRVPVERIIEKIIEVPVEHVVENVIEIPREKVVERVVHVPVEGKVIERVVEMEVPGRQILTVQRPIVYEDSMAAPRYSVPYAPMAPVMGSRIMGSRILR